MELSFDMSESSSKLLCAAFTVAVAVQSMNAFGQRVGHSVGRHAEACAWCAWVVYKSFHLGVFGVDAQSEGYFGIGLGCQESESLILRERIEGEV